MFWFSTQSFHINNNEWVKYGSHSSSSSSISISNSAFFTACHFAFMHSSPFIPFLPFHQASFDRFPFSPYGTFVLDMFSHLVPTFLSALSPLLHPHPLSFTHHLLIITRASCWNRRRGRLGGRTQPMHPSAGSANTILSGIRPRLVSLMYLY